MWVEFGDRDKSDRLEEIFKGKFEVKSEETLEWEMKGLFDI